MRTNIFKIIALFLLAFLMVQCNSREDRYTISGKLPANMKSDTVYLYNNSMKPINKAIAKDGKFIITGKVDQPMKAILGNQNDGFFQEFALENADFQFTNENGRPAVKGGELNDLLFGHQNTPEYVKLYEDYEKAYEKMEAETDPDKKNLLQNEVNKQSSKLMKMGEKGTQRVLNGNYPVEQKLVALLFVEDFKTISVDKQLSLLDSYEKKLGKNEMINSQRDYLNSLKQSAEEMDPKNDRSLEVGTKYFDQELLNTDGKMQKLSSVISQNKFTMLDFWASWCGYCREEFPTIKENYQANKDKGFEVLAVSIDFNDKDWREAMKEENVPWINLHEPDFKSDFIKKYGIVAVPVSYLISQDGTIVAKNDELRGKNLEKTLAKYIK